MPAASIKPTLAEVAAELRTRTVGDTSGGLGGDTQATPTTTFTASTRPTATEVQAIVDRSAGVIWARLEQPFDAARFTDTAKLAVALHAAIRIERSYFRESASRDLLDDMQREVDGLVADANRAPLNASGSSPSGFASLLIGTTRGEVW